MIDEKEISMNNPGMIKSPDNKNSTIKSPDSKDNSVIDSSFYEMSEYINRIKDQKYKEYIQKKYELIVKSFFQIDKDSNSLIDFAELLSFLNDGMKVIKN